MTERIKVRWIIAHFPRELFLRTAEKFQQTVEEFCPGEFEFEIHSLGTFAKQYKHLFTEEEKALFSTSTPKIGDLEDPNKTQGMKDPFTGKAVETSKVFNNNPFWKMIFKKLSDQAYEITQNQVSIIGSHLDHRFHAVDLPYLFNSHDHCTEVLDGPIGQRLGEGILEHHDIRGLAFTYSGGYRIIGSSKDIESIYDLSAQDFVTSTTPSWKFFTTAGVNPIGRHQAKVEDIERMDENGGAVETTYLRFGGKKVLKTNHSMFTTNILASEKFLQKLTEKQRNAFIEAAKIVAKAERLWSVEDADKYEADAEARGITIVPINAEEETVLREAAKKAFTSREDLAEIGVDYDTVNEIIEIGKKY